MYEIKQTAGNFFQIFFFLFFFLFGLFFFGGGRNKSQVKSLFVNKHTKTSSSAS